MSGIRGKNTKPEMTIRKGLHRRGFRFRLHSRHLPGKPDLVLPRYNTTIFVHGCFWHGHGCHLFKMPSTRREFWQAKIARNAECDQEVAKALGQKGWRRLVIWECAIKGKSRHDLNTLLQRITEWIKSGDTDVEIAGVPLV